MLLIGSRAFNHQFLNHSKPNDWDFIATEEEVINWGKENNIEVFKKNIVNMSLYTAKYNNEKYEFEIAENDNSASDYLNIIPNGISTPAILYSIKKSHIFFPINFDKHIKEYHFLRNELNGIDSLKNITSKRYKETSDRLNPKLPNLNKTIKEFVTESQNIVKRVFDHDDIHKVVAHGKYPAYFKIQPDTTKVWCSKKLWNNLSEKEKIEMVLEEAYVIALERKIVPMLFQQSKHWMAIDAVKWSIMRICTTLASGYFREFAVENYYKIVDNMNLEFIDKFLNYVEEGKVKLYTEEV